MDESFVPLDAYLRASTAPPREGRAFAEEVPAAPARDGDEPPVEIGDAIAAAKRFRAALEDALERELAQLLADVAADVVARELRTAPADVERIVAAAIERSRGETIVRVRAHPDDARALDASPVAVVADASLRRGDVVLEVASGSIDASLGARLEAVLER